MADIETSIVISAQIDGLRSGMEAAANSVQTATDAMRTQLAGLGDIAQQVQSQLTAATGQIGTGIGALQSRTSDLAGSIGAGMMPSSGPGDAGASGPVRTGAPPARQPARRQHRRKALERRATGLPEIPKRQGKTRSSGGADQPKNLAKPDAAHPASL